MRKLFIIRKICTHANRPPYSHKVDAYFEDFVHEHILTPLQLLSNEDDAILLSLIILTKDETKMEGIGIYEPSVLAEERIVYHPVSIRLEEVYKDDNVMENIISLYYQLISLFFIHYYEQVTSELMMALKEKLDWNYLLSIPYPAPYEEQQYVGDTSKQ